MAKQKTFKFPKTVFVKHAKFSDNGGEWLETYETAEEIANGPNPIAYGEYRFVRSGTVHEVVQKS